MKKKILIPILIVALLALLLVPVPTGVYKDGGTREYTALTYKIVDWNRLTGDDTYEKTKLYLFPNNFKSIDSLWYLEEQNVEYNFIAEVTEFGNDYAVVKVLKDSAVLSKDYKVSFSTEQLEDIDVFLGATVRITFKGGIMETVPSQINAVSWELSDDLRHLEYTDVWLNKETAEKYERSIFEHIKITRIYSNCFFARTVVPMPYEIKINGSLSDEWCVGDQVSCTYENFYYDSNSERVEVDMLTIEESDWQPDPYAAYKPVIYLYPEEETAVSVKLNLEGRLTCTYPYYDSGWNVTASPDGTLTDQKGQTYNYLYWEGEIFSEYDMSKGFCIKGEDTAAFLETALARLGLNRKEANEFIVFWLPLMEQNPYNIISFQTEAYTSAAELDINPAPDTVIRVFMTWKGADELVKLNEQNLSAPERKGFTVVEWGGTEID